MPPTPAPAPEQKVNVRRPDGSLVQATPAQAARLESLGWKRETPDQALARAEGEGAASYWGSGTQRAVAGAEAVLGGATLGLSDYVAGAGDKDQAMKRRAQANPGTRLAGETLGALVPIVLSGGAAAGARATTGVSRAAATVGRGTAEGALYGAAGAADHAYLAGDDITAEAVLHGLKWGGVLGGALSGAGAAVEGLGAHEAGLITAEKNALKAAQGKLDATAAERTAASFKSAADRNASNLAEHARRVAYEAEVVGRANAHAAAAVEAQNALAQAGWREALDKVGGSEFKAFAAEVRGLHGQVAATTKTADDAVAHVFDRVGAELGEDAAKALRGRYAAVERAARAGDQEALDRAISEFSTHVNSAADRLVVKDAEARGARIGGVADSLYDDVGDRADDLLRRGTEAEAQEFRAAGARGVWERERAKAGFPAEASAAADARVAEARAAGGTPREPTAVLDESGAPAGESRLSQPSPAVEAGPGGTRVIDPDRPLPGREVTTPLERPLSAHGAPTAEDFVIAEARSRGPATQVRARPEAPGVDEAAAAVERAGEPTSIRLGAAGEAASRAASRGEAEAAMAKVYLRPARGAAAEAGTGAGLARAGVDEGTAVLGKASHRGSAPPSPPPVAEVGPEALAQGAPLPPDIQSGFLPKPRLPDPAGALREAARLRASQAVLKDFPATLEEFAAMTPARVERVTAALERASASTGSTAARDALARFAEAAGVGGKGELRHVHSAVADVFDTFGEPTRVTHVPIQPKEFKPPKLVEGKAFTARKLERLPRGLGDEGHGHSLVKQIAGYALGGKAYLAARGAGLGRGTAYGAFRAVKDAVTDSHLWAARSETLARLRESAAEFLPRAGAGFARTAGPVSFATALDGTPDPAAKGADLRTLARRRVDEIAAFAPRASDVLYSAVAPIAGTQPELAPAVHAAGVRAFQALMEMAPRDPGVVSGLRSIWKPSHLEAAKFAKQYAVFHDPVSEAVGMLKSGAIDPVKVEALRAFAPAVYADLRAQLLVRVANAKIMDSATYRDQISMSALLDLPTHTALRPDFIATSQQVFLDRAAPLEPKPGGRASPPGGSQAAMNATAAQRTEQR